MKETTRAQFGCGVTLVAIGGLLLAIRLLPALGDWADRVFDWPLIIIGVGAMLLLIGVLTNAPGMAVPAAIVSGIGGLLYWQNDTGNWESWAYAWTLIPGFVGLGIVLMGVLQGGKTENLRGGAWLMAISLFLFFLFGSFLGGGGLLGPYWPALLIVLGAYLLVRSLLDNRSSIASEGTE